MAMTGILAGTGAFMTDSLTDIVKMLNLLSSLEKKVINCQYFSKKKTAPIFIGAVFVARGSLDLQDSAELGFVEAIVL